MMTIAQPYSSTITVRNSAELKAAIANSSGDTTIVLDGGDYGAVSINNKTTGSITLVSAESDNPAVMTLSIKGSQNILIDGVTFKPSGEKWANALAVNGSSNIRVTNSDFIGVDPTYADAARGLYVNNSNNISLTENHFSGLTRGSVITNSQYIEVLRNEVTDMRSEGFNFAAVSDVEIAGNTGTNFRPLAGDHPDFIQFWSAGVTTPSSNIYIHDNTLTVGNGAGAQGIFLGNENHLAYSNVVITDNNIQTTYPNGIAVYEANGVIIRGNTALATSESAYRVQIRVSSSTDVEITDNTANVISAPLSTHVISSNNDLVTLLDHNAAANVASVTAFAGTAGNDVLAARQSDATLYGFDGNDVLRGGGGNDLIAGGKGSDQMTGGLGADTFSFDQSDVVAGMKSIDKIYDLDFSQGDELSFAGFGDFGQWTDDSALVTSYESLRDLVAGSDGLLTANCKGATDVLILTLRLENGGINEIHISNAWNAFNASDLNG